MVDLITSSDENDGSSDGFGLDSSLKAEKNDAAAVSGTLDNFSRGLQGKASNSIATAEQPPQREGPR